MNILVNLNYNVSLWKTDTQIHTFQTCGEQTLHIPEQWLPIIYIQELYQFWNGLCDVVTRGKMEL